MRFFRATWCCLLAIPLGCQALAQSGWQSPDVARRTTTPLVTVSNPDPNARFDLRDAGRPREVTLVDPADEAMQPIEFEPLTESRQKESPTYTAARVPADFDDSFSADELPATHHATPAPTPRGVRGGTRAVLQGALSVLDASDTASNVPDEATEPQIGATAPTERAIPWTEADDALIDEAATDEAASEVATEARQASDDAEAMVFVPSRSTKAVPHAAVQHAAAQHAAVPDALVESAAVQHAAVQEQTEAPLPTGSLIFPNRQGPGNFIQLVSDVVQADGELSGPYAFQADSLAPAPVPPGIMPLPTPDEVPSAVAPPPPGAPVTANPGAPASGLIPLPQEVADRAMEALNMPFDGDYIAYPNRGTERVPFAPFEIEHARPVNMLRLRMDVVSDLESPDRAEYFWGKIGGKGPKNPESQIDYLEYSLYNETALGPLASGFIQIPLRTVDPANNPHSTNIGDMQVGAKSILMQGDDFFGVPTGRPGDRFQLSTVFRTYISFSPILARRGSSTGHLSLEPGLLANYQLSQNTYIHGEAKLWIPIAGTNGHAGNVVKHGIGISHVLYSDQIETANCRSIAVIPTLEFVGWDFANGSETLGSGAVVSSGNTYVMNIQPGVRLALGENSELGFSYAMPISDDRRFDDMFRIEFRWFR